MIFTPLRIAGAYRIDPTPMTDARGFFARTWCEEEIVGLGLDSRIAQCSISFNEIKGTLRGMHYQRAPNEEAKVVRCTRGAIYDVVLDLRPESPTYRSWTVEELTDGNRAQIYVPQGVAHGFQTLKDATEVLYMISTPYSPDCARGVRWDDPAFGIEWPRDGRTISDRDLAFHDYVE